MATTDGGTAPSSPDITVEIARKPFKPKAMIDYREETIRYLRSLGIPWHISEIIARRSSISSPLTIISGIDWDLVARFYPSVSLNEMRTVTQCPYCHGECFLYLHGEIAGYCLHCHGRGEIGILQGSLPKPENLNPTDDGIPF